MMRSLFIVFMFLLVGCASNNVGINIDSSNQNVVLGDSALSDDLELGNAKTERVNDRLQAIVMVKNKSSKTQYLEYRFYWYDKQGLELNVGQSPWKSFILYGQDAKTLQGIAVDPSTENYRLSIRYAK